MARGKYYVVWEGRAPGIYDSWEECQAMIEGYSGARYRAFVTLEEATAAFRGQPDSQLAMVQTIARHAAQVVNYSAYPEIHTNAIAVDGACASNPGPMEYRGVEVATGREVFHVGPYQGGTNNIAEYIAIIHAAALLAQRGDTTTPIYSDSVTGLAWVRRGHSRTTIVPTEANAPLRELLARADRWRATHQIINPIIKWDTSRWGEIPADFGRK